MNDEVNAVEENREEPQEQEAMSAPQVPAGAQLTALREARGWTIEQVASQLNLASRQVQALEADNYAALPGMVIVRGFIRSYAKLLRADAAPILAGIAAEQSEPVVLQDRGSLSATFSEGKMPSAKPNAASSKILFVVLAVVVIAALGFLAQRMGWMSKTDHAMNAANAVKEEAPQPMTAPVSSDPSETEASAAATMQAPAVEAEQVAPVQPQAAVEEKTQTPAAVPIATESVSGSAAPVAVDSKNALVFQVKEDTWVEIRRADDSILVSRLLKAGTTEAFEITAPSSMVIGNAAGVNVTLRGKPLDISGNSSNVARLNVK
ncbi:helix-turn-helix domain-containing protein [Oxalicibacterium solurbis]|uniref:XRE family transcriptional regulator n=1 Tax=Oxalicibacterium solurbis TaxID=69280 RepID=A0A8J3AVT6_9BURK|nr:helix-turn-helix domain-containing protein [Oxalicibacterium solurbis]GGI54519.1 XRE family transcriptional regulator [Oxalicibacterium solurbis]